MKKSLFLFLLLALGLMVQAQNISVKSFKALPYDGSASSLNGKRIDQNGEVAAIIKVVTTETGFSFEGGRLGIVDTQQRNGEIWVWVPRGLRKITILHQQLGVLRDYMFPETIEAERTYEMVLTTDEIETVVKKKVTQQYLAFKITPTNATLEVNDELWSVDAEGNASKYVDFGTYSYRVRASDYITDAGLVTVDDPANKKQVVVNLKPNFATVTLAVNADAEIWVNDVKKGTRSWTGPLGKGIYKIECKQAGHETTMISKEITVEMNGETVLLPAPRAVNGSLNVESTPNSATIYLDGKEIGETPMSINELLVGQHIIKLTKKGYSDYTETITIAKDERKQVTATLTTLQAKRTAPAGAVDGLFSVSGSKQVYFSQGNLQYQASTNTWRFAEHQYDVVGNGHRSVSSGYRGWIDLFGWGTSGYNGKNPYMTSTTPTDYGNGLTDIASTNYDWGVYNKISNGGNQAGLWRTLTKDEWVYVFDTRSTTSGIRYAKACVNNMNGVILLPDDWNSSYYNLNNSNKSGAGYNSNTISASQWTTLEQHGAVFLPAAGYRNGTSVDYVGSYGNYWSASYHIRDIAYGVYFSGSDLGPQGGYYRAGGLGVRLVLSFEGNNSQTDPNSNHSLNNSAPSNDYQTDEETFTVDGVTFTMKLVEGGTFQMGATSEQGSDAYDSEKPVHSVTLSNYYIGETEVTQALWEAVMGTTIRQQRDKANKSWPLRAEGSSYPMYYVNWNDCQEFIRKLNQKTGKNFRLPTEAEWEYAARGGKKGKGTKYAGSNTIGNVAWYNDNSGNQTHAVKTKSPNELGLYDMSGNVWEWCQDRYGKYSSGSQSNPQGPSSGSNRMLRGGSWNYNAGSCRVSPRYSSNPDYRNHDNGFRLALTQ